MSMSSVNDSLQYHVFLLMIAACIFIKVHQTGYIFSSYRRGKKYRIHYLVPDCGKVKFCFEKLWPPSELNFAKSPPELGLKAQVVLISVSALVHPDKIYTKCTLVICLFNHQTGIWFILFLNICRVEYNTSLAGSLTNSHLT